MPWQSTTRALDLVKFQGKAKKKWRKATESEEDNNTSYSGCVLSDIKYGSVGIFDEEDRAIKKSKKKCNC